MKFYKLQFIFFIFASFSIFAANDSDIVSKYHLNVGQYLLPAEKKVQIKDWLNPSLKDYKILQDYLKNSKRPELQYINYPGTNWREKRIRDFKIIEGKKKPQFKTLYLNKDPLNKKNCIVTFVSFNKNYISSLNLLIKKLKSINFDGHVIFRIGGWPHAKHGGLKYFDVPYAFKIFSLLEAKELGYTNCLWLDAPYFPLKNLNPLFKHIQEHGVLFRSNGNYSLSGHIQNFAAESLDMSLSSFLKEQAVAAGVIGLNFKNQRGLDLLNLWHKTLVENKLSFISFIPEQATLTHVVNKLKLLPYSINDKYFAHSQASITSDTILFWNRERIKL